MTSAARTIRFSLSAALLFGAGAGVVRGDENTLRNKLALPASVDWVDAPLGSSLSRLSASTGVRIFLDRRIDPTRRVTVSVRGRSLEETFAAVLGPHGLGAAPLGPVVYIGPADAAELLPRLVSRCDQQMKKLTKRDRARYASRASLSWQRLTEPRSLIEKAAAATRRSRRGDAATDGADLVPHDLWPAGEMPPMRRADQLTLLLIGFDLTWSPTGDGPRVEAIDPAALPAATPRLRRRTAPGPTEQRYTLRVVNQPFLPVLEQLAARLGHEVVIDDLPEGATERGISFEVERATLGELLGAVGRAAGASVTLEPRGVVVGRP